MYIVQCSENLCVGRSTGKRCDEMVIKVVGFQTVVGKVSVELDVSMDVILRNWKLK